MIAYRIKFVLNPGQPILIWDEFHNGKVIVEDPTTKNREVDTTTYEKGKPIESTYTVEEALGRGEKEIFLEDLNETHLMKHDGKFRRIANIERLGFPPGITKEQAANPDIEDNDCLFDDCSGKLILCPVRKDSIPGVSLLYCPSCDMSFSICEDCREILADINVIMIRGNVYCKECAQKYTR